MISTYHLFYSRMDRDESFIIFQSKLGAPPPPVASASSKIPTTLYGNNNGNNNGNGARRWSGGSYSASIARTLEGAGNINNPPTRVSSTPSGPEQWSHGHQGQLGRHCPSYAAVAGASSAKNPNKNKPARKYQQVDKNGNNK